MKVALVQLEAHLPEVTSAQLVPFTHCAQVSSGLPQLASQENPDEFRLQLWSLSQASLQLALLPHPASPTPHATRQPIHHRFTFASRAKPRPSSGPRKDDALHRFLVLPGRTGSRPRGGIDPLPGGTRQWQAPGSVACLSDMWGFA